MKDDEKLYWSSRATRLLMQVGFIKHAVDEIDQVKLVEFLADADLIEKIANELRRGAEASQVLRAQAKARRKQILKRADVVYRERTEGDWSVMSAFLTGVALALDTAAKIKVGMYFHSNVYLYDAVDDAKFARGEAEFWNPLQEMKWQQNFAEELISTNAA